MDQYDCSIVWPRLETLELQSISCDGHVLTASSFPRLRKLFTRLVLAYPNALSDTTTLREVSIPLFNGVGTLASSLFDMTQLERMDLPSDFTDRQVTLACRNKPRLRELRFNHHPGNTRKYSMYYLQMLGLFHLLSNYQFVCQTSFASGYIRLHASWTVFRNFVFFAGQLVYTYRRFEYRSRLSSSCIVWRYGIYHVIIFVCINKLSLFHLYMLFRRFSLDVTSIHEHYFWTIHLGSLTYQHTWCGWHPNLKHIHCLVHSPF